MMRTIRRTAFAPLLVSLFSVGQLAHAQFHGLVIAWGYNEYGQCDAPAPNAEFVAVDGGYHHSLGLKTDGSIVAWGRNQYGQCDIATPNADFIAVAAGRYHNIGLKANGSIVGWGYNYRNCLASLGLD
ncbi:MAG: hypothetical protein V1790_02135 [Planctomycetota bacterium]